MTSVRMMMDSTHPQMVCVTNVLWMQVKASRLLLLKRSLARTACGFHRFERICTHRWSYKEGEDGILRSAKNMIEGLLIILWGYDKLSEN
ncbi:hypothetical protein WT40_19180 [Burkholderia territorii]|nr:hypothetical protein WT40_19180 [Burkholderia territorii]